MIPLATSFCQLPAHAPSWSFWFFVVLVHSPPPCGRGSGCRSAPAFSHLDSSVKQDYHGADSLVWNLPLLISHAFLLTTTGGLPSLARVKGPEDLSRTDGALRRRGFLPSLDSAGLRMVRQRTYLFRCHGGQFPSHSLSSGPRLSNPLIC